MKSIACLFLCALSTLVVAGEESRFAPFLSEIRQFEAPPVDVEQMKAGTARPFSSATGRLTLRPVPPISFWESIIQLAEFDEQEVKDFCRIAEFASGPEARLKAGTALERLNAGIGHTRSAELLARQERAGRCLHRATGVGDGFERSATYKKILREKLELTRKGA
jgi:hypothetical protein